MRQSIFFLFLSIFFMSCFTEFEADLDKIQGQIEFNAPILSGTFTMEDYVDATSDDITVTQDQNGVVIIEYTGEQIASDYAEDLIEVPNQIFNNTLSFNATEVIDFPINLTLNKSASYDEEISVESESTDELDSIYLKSGTLIIEVETLLPADGEVDIFINTFKINGEVISFNTSWTYNPNTPGVQTIRETIDLSGAFGDFTKNGTAHNNFNFDVEARLSYAGQPLSGGDQIAISIGIENPRFQLVYGKFSEREFETEMETVALGLFDEVDIEGFYLDQPRVEFNFISSYGVPVEASILTLDASNSEGQVLPFTGPAITDPVQVIGPALDAVGSSELTTLVINKTNSNITDVISFLPSQLDYQFTGKVITPSPTVSHFVLDTSRVIGDYKVVLPLDGSVVRFQSEQIVEMGGDTEGLDNIGETTLILKSSNGLPITVGMELLFLDEFDNELITLFKDENALEPGEIDNDGYVVEPTENILEKTLAAEEMKLVLGAEKAIIKTILNTGETGSEVVKFRMTDEISILLSFQTSLRFFE